MTRPAEPRRSTWGWSIGWALALPCTLAGGCASLSNLTGGEDRDGGADARVTHDAAYDQHAASVDGGSLEGGTRDGTTDTTVDSRSTSNATDARADADGARRDGRAADAGRDAPCVQTLVDAGPNVACAAAEAGACAPTPPPDGSFAWHPPHQTLGACTPLLVQNFLGACLSSYSTDESCNTYLAAEPALTCAKCLFGDSTDPTYGPIVDTPQFAFLNTGGCLALADPCNVDCAVAAEMKTLCAVAACEGRCFPDGGSFDADYAAYGSCTASAAGCACASQGGVASACFYALNDQPSTAPCYGVGTFNESVEAIASLFCINGTWDAGTSD